MLGREIVLRAVLGAYRKYVEGSLNKAISQSEGKERGLIGLVVRVKSVGSC
jgi:hypothetical protein